VTPWPEQSALRHHAESSPQTRNPRRCGRSSSAFRAGPPPPSHGRRRFFFQAAVCLRKDPSDGQRLGRRILDFGDHRRSPASRVDVSSVEMLPLDSAERVLGACSLYICPDHGLLVRQRKMRRLFTLPCPSHIAYSSLFLSPPPFDSELFESPTGERLSPRRRPTDGGTLPPEGSKLKTQLAEPVVSALLGTCPHSAPLEAVCMPVSRKAASAEGVKISPSEDHP